MTSQLDLDIAFANTMWEEELPEIRELSNRLAYVVLDKTRIITTLPFVEISLVLADDVMLQNLNKKHRKQDKPTNVLSFPTIDLSTIEKDVVVPFPLEKMAGEPHIHLGDVVMSFQRLMEEAKEQGKEFRNHYAHLFVHGLLHLLGYTHNRQKDAALMETMEKDVLMVFEIPDPYLSDD